MSSLSRIKSLTRISGLSLKEKDELIEFLSQIDENSLAALIELFERKPRWILKIYQNTQNKKAALDRREKKCGRK